MSTKNKEKYPSDKQLFLTASLLLPLTNEACKIISTHSAFDSTEIRLKSL